MVAARIVRRAAGRAGSPSSAAVVALSLLLLLLLLAGCGGGESAEGGWSGEVTDSAGIALVANGEGGVWGPGEAWTVSEELRIGTTEGDPDYQFGRISGLGVTSDGRIFVMDQQARHLKVFGPDGVHRRNVGSPGSGPGEFGPGAGPVLVTPGDTLWVPDLQNQRVNRIVPDGSPAESFPLSLSDGIPMGWAASRDGRIVLHRRPFSLPGQPPADTMDALLELASDGSVRDTLLEVPSGKTFSFAGDAPSFEFFVPEPQWALAGDGSLVFGVNDAYRLLFHGPSGEVRRIVTRPAARAPVAEADRAAIRSSMERLWEEAGVPPAALSQLRSAIAFADSFPAYYRFLAGPERTLWVQRVLPPSRNAEGGAETFDVSYGLGAPEWEVLDGEGRYLGVVRLPERFQPLAFREDRIYGSWRDELDVQHVIVLAIERGGVAGGSPAPEAGGIGASRAGGVAAVAAAPAGRDGSR